MKNAKQKIVLLLISFLFILFAFVKNNNRILSFEKLSNRSIKAIKLNSISDVKIAYSFLSYKEKEIIWLTKWEAILINDKNELTSVQKELILDLIYLLNSNGIKKLIEYPIIGHNYFKKNYVKLSSNFSKLQLLYLLEFPAFSNDFSINEIYLKKFNSTFKPVGNGNCTCYYSLYCIGDGVCMDGKCTKINGCGILGTSNCTGICR